MSEPIAVPAETQYATVADLRKDRIREVGEDYAIPRVGTVRIRGLSRGEFLIANKRYPNDMEAQERYVLSRAVTIPEVTEADVEAWQNASGVSEINALANRVNELSGIGKGAEKSEV